MATNKTIQPTNVTVQIPEMTDKPNQATNSNCLDKIIDGVNALNSNLSNQQSYANGLLSAITVHTANNADANNYKESGTYYFTTGCSNVPGTYFLFTVINHTGGDFVIQFGARAAEKTRFYIRMFSSNSWAEWSEIALK